MPPTAEYQPGGLIVSDHPVSHRYVTIPSGQELKRGAVIGRITVSDKYVLSLSAAEDGSQVPRLVMAVDVNASAGDVTAPAYGEGEFAADKLVFGAGHTAATVEAAWRQAGVPLYVRTRA